MSSERTFSSTASAALGVVNVRRIAAAHNRVVSSGLWEISLYGNADQGIGIPLDFLIAEARLNSDEWTIL